MKYEKIKAVSCIPVKKISSDVLTENIYYLLIHKGSMLVEMIVKELEFFSEYEILKSVKKSKLFEIEKSGKLKSISIKWSH